MIIPKNNQIDFTYTPEFIPDFYIPIGIITKKNWNATLCWDDVKQIIVYILVPQKCCIPDCRQ